MSQSHLIYQVSSSRPEMEKLCQEHAKENGFAISTCGSRRDSALYHAKNGGFCNNHELSYQGEDRYTYAANVLIQLTSLIRMVHSLGSMGSHASDESEATTTRRIAGILEESSLDICQTCRYNEVVLVLQTSTLNRAAFIERPSHSPSLALKQQCKNLRTSGAILGHLQVLSPAKHFDHDVAMDWIGMVGYIYLLADVQQVYFAKKIGILRLSKAPKDFIDFKETLNLLFAYHVWKHFILDTAVEAQSAMDIRQTREVRYALLLGADLVQEFHDGYGHAGKSTAYDLLRNRWRWPNMKMDIETWLSRCQECQLAAGVQPEVHHSPMHLPSVPAPFARWYLEFIGELPTTQRATDGSSSRRTMQQVTLLP
ncbi:hypothetical protein BCR43DRAFT_510470 [Syncephalastrum racemosum]|uniref:Integrase zinc-binding domain-containing protein n=1 Tax=Syncephalastrum racemosum TaxID=13706 RepID=A0A1X2HVA1_SYNRA|nr:hypothetical protein BCR43DRAFT_510470 [Syncephalastrum racemosum]